MTSLEFLKGMKKLSAYYLKDLNEEELSSWYEIFSKIDVEIFYMAVKSIGTKNKYFPVVSELYEECRKQRPIYLTGILESNKSIPENEKKYLKDMIHWYSIQEEFPQDIIDNIMKYRSSKQINSKNQALIGNKE